MKKLILSALLIISIGAHAQKNDTTTVEHAIYTTEVSDSIPIISMRDLDELLTFYSAKLIHNDYKIVEQVVRDLALSAIRREQLKMQKPKTEPK